MGVALCKKWWHRGAPRIRGNFAEMEKDLLSNRALAAKGRALGIDKCLLTNPGLTTVSDMMVADAIEAVAGAVYLDGGDKAVKNVMKGLGLDKHACLNKG
ncbi:hypothetical protein BCR34DRAFT_599420 [Clohesyomyces aquaticus]|uniref:RNase III domain-containing protein n=1 Tax=Clohesyomyces aquaticus TaxID=1231657 RepID=A0A1Y1ZUU3_9PLEO|nr:hypothetical protein BCR34DRAFT_599420 [Clohesyomyces aquaticus]